MFVSPKSFRIKLRIALHLSINSFLHVIITKKKHISKNHNNGFEEIFPINKSFYDSKKCLMTKLQHLAFYFSEIEKFSCVGKKKI